jgi:glutamyl-tRNA reductase
MVPRDVEAVDGEVAGVGIYSVDDLQSVIEENLALRRGAIPQVEAIIDEERRRFAEWYYGREVAPVIRDLRAWAQQVAGEELEQALRRLSTADERTRQIVATLSHRLVNRLLHEPTTRLRLQALEGNGDGVARAVRELFALDQKAPPERDTTGGSLAATVQERTA